METGLISIIVPVYKSEKFLKKCVDSILSQTYTKIEIILVNDGSPDGSGLICDEYAKKDDRVRVIHKENGGVSTARNAGLDAALGEFVGFVDSDDYVDEDMFETLLKRITDTGADIACCGIKFYYYGYVRYVKVPFDGMISPTCFWTALLKDFRRYRVVVPGSACGKLFRRNLIQDQNPTRFQVNMTIGEDAWFVADLLFKSKSELVLVDFVPYNYIITANPNSAYKTGNESMEQDLLEHIRRIMEAVLPDKKHEIDKLIKCQKCAFKLTMVHGQVVNSLALRTKLEWETVSTILKLSKNKEEMLSAILLFFLPGGIYRFVFRLYCQLICRK